MGAAGLSFLVLLSGCSYVKGSCYHSLEVRHTVSCVDKNDLVHVEAVRVDAPSYKQPWR